MIALKRVYEPASPDDGYRVLVDRLWPRGVSKAEAQVDAWPRDLSPSTELRKWFGHAPDRWSEFHERYRAELARPDVQPHLVELAQRARHGTVTLLFAAKDTQRNNAQVLREVLEQRLEMES